MHFAAERSVMCSRRTKRDPFVQFQNAKGNAIYAVAAWIGAVVCPLFMIGAVNKYSNYQEGISIGVIAAIIPLLAIRTGFRALRFKRTSDFIVYALTTMIIFVLSTGHMIFFPGIWFGSNT